MRRAAFILFRSSVALYLGVGAVLKLPRPDVFVFELERYRLTSPQATLVLGWWIPWFELVVSLALLAGMARRGAWLLCVLIGLGFSFFVGSALWRGLDIGCGCFGVAGGSLGTVDFLRALGFLAASVFGFFLERKQVSGTQL